MERYFPLNLLRVGVQVLSTPCAFFGFFFWVKIPFCLIRRMSACRTHRKSGRLVTGPWDLLHAPSSPPAPLFAVTPWHPPSGPSSSCTHGVRFVPAPFGGIFEPLHLMQKDKKQKFDLLCSWGLYVGIKNVKTQVFFVILETYRLSVLLIKFFLVRRRQYFLSQEKISPKRNFLSSK